MSMPMEGILCWGYIYIKLSLSLPLSLSLSHTHTHTPSLSLSPSLLTSKYLRDLFPQNLNENDGVDFGCIGKGVDIDPPMNGCWGAVAVVGAAGVAGTVSAVDSDESEGRPVEVDGGRGGAAGAV